MKNRRILAGTGLAALSLLVVAGPALADPVAISGKTPFVNTDCDNTGLGGTLYEGSELEPFLGVNPTDPDNLIAVYQQDRWSNGGARGNAASISTDGGATWKVQTFNKLTKCTGGTWARATDPWVTFSPNGTAYAMHLVFDNFPPANRPGGEAPNAMVVSRLANGGADWSDPVTLIKDVSPRLFNDKNSMTADPTDSKYVYGVWDRLSTPTGYLINPERTFGLGYKGPALFTRTTNGGTSWEPAKTIYDPGANNQTIGNQIVVGKTGRLFDFFDEIFSFRTANGGVKSTYNLAYVYSDDKGASWKPKGQSRRIQTMQTVGVVLPTAGQPNDVRTGDIIPDVAVDRASGNLYAVWQDSRFSNGRIDQVAFSQSADGGTTWSTPIKVSTAPDTIPLLNQQGFNASVHAKADGTVVVTWYDFRNATATAALTDYWAISCAAGSDCSQASSWTGEKRLTAPSFDITKAPYARGYFLGDYEGLDDADGNSVAIFAQPQGSDPSNILFTKF